MFLLAQLIRLKSPKMNTNSLFVISLLSILFSCSTPNKTNNSQTDQAFDSFKEAFMDAYWKQYPGSSLWAGYGKYDHILTIPNEATRSSSRQFCNNYLKELKTFDQEKLTPNNRTDWKMIKNELESSLWSLDKFKGYEWTPSSYNIAGSFNQILINQNRPIEKRLEIILQRLENVPVYYLAAQQNIKNPTQEYTELAIRQNEGGLNIFKQKIPDSIAVSTLDDPKKQALTTKCKEATDAINGYVSFLNGLLTQGRPFKKFRIGEQLFEEKFKYNIVSEYTAKQMFEKALAHKQNIHSEMAKMTRTLWPKYFKGEQPPADSLVMIKKMIDRIADKHATKEGYFDAIKNQIPELTKFVKEKDLLYLDPSKPLEVRVTPAFQRGFSIASISAPGPYDKDGPTFYNVSPIDDYSDERAESHLREYNHYLLQVLNIHEAIPGHYAQLVYSNKSPSIIKSVFGNGAMIEGWAVYTEKMMLEEGYGNHEPEMWLMYYKWNLRVTCNTIIDYGIHVLNYSEKQVLDILMNQAFQESAEANGKWRRATLSQVQLCSYFSGFKEIYDFRETLKKKQGVQFNLKAFHEQFLSYGSAPVKYVKELMDN